jgi:hypothetical protein
MHRPFVFKNKVSETGICLFPQVKPTRLDPNDRSNPFLRMMDNGQEVNNHISTPSSHTLHFVLLKCWVNISLNILVLQVHLQSLVKGK